MFKRLFLAILILSMSAADLSATEIYIGTGFGGKIESGSFREDLERFSEAGTTSVIRTVAKDSRTSVSDPRSTAFQLPASAGGRWAGSRPLQR
jgi:hypothetical protein